MNLRSVRALVALLCVLACAAGGAAWLWPSAGYVRTEDQNGDGRPDVWRVYDRQRQLAEVAVDTNFDGRSDVHEYYERGVLVRRESDRDFNDRVDLVEEFDPATHDRARSLVDVNYDGTADLLILFQGDRPVFSKWADPAPAAFTGADVVPIADAPARSANDPLAALDDPFRTDLTVRAARIPVNCGDAVGLSTSGGLPASRCDLVGLLTSSSDVAASSFARLPSALIVPSPRGPPLASLLLA